jgi:dTDP-4-amino-4,6-dideoxygalactose transaminase
MNEQSRLQNCNEPERARLAVLGSKPAFAEPLHVGRPHLGDRDAFLKRLNDILDRRWLTNAGPSVREFEKRLATMLDVKHCIAMCNATVALEIAIRAAGLRGEVIIPSYTFVATAHALQWQEITPVFCDVDPTTHHLDPAKVEQLITDRTSGIIGVHLWGRACEIDALTEIARQRNLTLLFDAAHAFACTYKGKPIGQFGLAEVFSFHATKFINTFEGGAVTTNSDELAQKIRLMKNFGFADYDKVVYIGTNGKMTEVCAAMGLSSLDAIDDILAANVRNYESYRAGLVDIPGIRLMEYSSDERRNYQYIVLEINSAATQLNRDDLINVLHAENILARRYFWPGCHRMEPYRSLQPNAGLVLPETERIASRVIVLPTGSAVSPADIETICQILRTAFDHAEEVRKRIHPVAETT